MSKPYLRRLVLVVPMVRESAPPGLRLGLVSCEMRVRKEKKKKTQKRETETDETETETDGEREGGRERPETHTEKAERALPAHREPSEQPKLASCWPLHRRLRPSAAARGPSKLNCATDLSAPSHGQPFKFHVSKVTVG